MKSDARIRINAYIAASTSLSRRASDKAIEDKRVLLNGAIATLGDRVDVNDIVTLDGVTIEPYEKHTTYALNKPKGYVCSNDDPHAKHFARSLVKVPEQERLHSIGRLDKESEGLILFTTDGYLTERITHPRNHIEKEYYVKATNQITPRDIKALRSGIIDKGEKLRVKSVELMSNKEALLVLEEGKNREIRRMFDSLENPVLKLVRLRIGGYSMPSNLPQGSYVRLTDSDLANLTKKID